MKPKSRTTAILILILVFGIGTLSGVGGTMYYFHNKQKSRVKVSAEARQNRQISRVEDRLSRMLALTEEQRASIRGELFKFAEAFKALNRELRPQFRALSDEKLKAIESHLDEEQTEKFRVRYKARCLLCARNVPHSHNRHRSGKNAKSPTPEKEPIEPEPAK